MRDPADRSDTDPLDSLLCFAIYSAGLAFGRVYRPLLEETGLTYVQYVVMVALWSRDDRTVGDVCDALFLTTSTLTPVLQKLAAKGLVRRSRGPDDEREVHVRLTEAGAKLRRKAEPLPDCVQSATGLDAEGLRNLRGAVSALRDNLLEAGRSQPPAPQGRPAAVLGPPHPRALSRSRRRAPG